MKKFFNIAFDDTMDVDVLLLVTEQDYNNGNIASLNSDVLDDSLYDKFEELGCFELMDGVFEVAGDIEEIKTTLTKLGFEEKEFSTN